MNTNSCIHIENFGCPHGTVLEGQSCFCEEFETAEDTLNKTMRALRSLKLIGLDDVATAIQNMMKDGVDVTNIVKQVNNNMEELTKFEEDFNSVIDKIQQGGG